MERIEGSKVRSASCGAEKTEQVVVIESLQLGAGDELHRLMSSSVHPPDSGSSFTALLELPPNQAMELLHFSRATEESPSSAEFSGETWSNSLIDQPKPYHHHRSFNCTPTFPSNAVLLDRASKFSVFAAAAENSPDTSSIPSNSSHKVKQEAVDMVSTPPNSSSMASDPMIPNQNHKPTKRKEREKKVKGSTKKSKSAAVDKSDEEKLPYVHVRARRGQATDSHSLAERARREKINARMKLLQELVPGCSKISGTAMVLDEIITHVQSLQRQVEILSMRLAAVNPRIDFDLDSLLAAESGSLSGSNFPGVVMPLVAWAEGEVHGNRQQQPQQYQQQQQQWHFDGIHQQQQQQVWGEEENPNFLTPENSLLTYDSSTNLESLQ